MLGIQLLKYFLFFFQQKKKIWTLHLHNILIVFVLWTVLKCVPNSKNESFAVFFGTFAQWENPLKMFSSIIVIGLPWNGSGIFHIVLALHVDKIPKQDQQQQKKNVGVQ